MKLTKIITIALSVVAIGLAFYLYSRIKFAIDDEKRIDRHEQTVIAKLSLIREAELAYLSVHGSYASNWDSLESFMQNGIFHITQRSEEIITLSYGADSIIVHIDTLGTVKVYDSLFSPARYPNLDFNRLKYIPGTDNKIFDLFADEIIKGGVTVDVVEVRDTAPVNPNRREKHEARNRKPLRFGSRTEVTTAGNWE